MANNYTLPNPSKIQIDIINAIEDHNIVINSAAGSGKTTTALHIAKHYHDKNILLLTYSASLKSDSSRKCEILEINNMEARSFHSFLNRYYGTCHNDQHMRKILKNPRIRNHYSFDMLIVDEVQDMRWNYYKIVKLIIKTAHINRLIIIGDVRQCIYDYKAAGADSRFLTLYRDLYHYDNWREFNMIHSYRITTPIANFINNQTYQRVVIESDKQGVDVSIIPSAPTAGNDCVITQVIGKYREYMTMGYNPDDVFILVPSTRFNNHISPIVQIANALTNANINIYIASNDIEGPINAELMVNKTVFSTFHRAKGLERKIVFVLNFENSYFKYYARSKNPNTCPNTIYVAMTRASERLILVKWVGHPCNTDFNFLTDRQGEQFTRSNNNTSRLIIPSRICIHMADSDINNILTYFDTTTLQEPEEYIEIDNIVEQGDINEQVSDITGIVIPLFCSRKLLNKHIKYSVKKYIEEALDTFKKRTGLLFRNKQIKEFNWITKSHLRRAFRRFKHVVPPGAIYEQQIKYKKIKGFIDCIAGDTLFEFKCTKTLTPTHYIQVAIYMYITRLQFKHYILFNIMTNERIELTSTTERLNEMINYIRHIDSDGTAITDADFIQIANTVRENIESYNQDVNSTGSESSDIDDSNESEIDDVPPLIEYDMEDYLGGENNSEIDENISSTSNSEHSEIDETQTEITHDNYMVLHVSTHDMEKLIIQITYTIFDNEHNVVLNKRLVVRNDQGLTDHFGKVSHDEVMNGISEYEALSTLLSDLQLCNKIVCHNIDFFINRVLKKRFRNHKLHFDEHDYTLTCTMRETTNFVKVRGNYGGYRWPPLDALYYKLFREVLDEEQHRNGIYDVEIVAKCYKELIRRGIL